MKTRNVSAMVEREFHVLTVKWKLYGEPVHFTALWELKCSHKFTTVHFSRNYLSQN